MLPETLLRVEETACPRRVPLIPGFHLLALATSPEGTASPGSGLELLITCRSLTVGHQILCRSYFSLPVVGPSYVISATSYTWQGDVVFGNLMKTNTIVTDSNYNSLFPGERVGETLAQEPRLACWIRLWLFGGVRGGGGGCGVAQLGSLSLQVSRCQRFKQVPCSWKH